MESDSSTDYLEPQAQAPVELPLYTDTSNSSMWLTKEEYRELGRRNFCRVVFETSGATLLWVAATIAFRPTPTVLLLFLLYRCFIGFRLHSYPRQLASLTQTFKKNDAWLPFVFKQLTENIAAIAHCKNGEFAAACARNTDPESRVFCWFEGGNLDSWHDKLSEKYRRYKNEFDAASLGHVLLLKGDAKASLAYCQEAIKLSTRNWRASTLFALLNSARAHTRLNNLEESDRLLEEVFPQASDDGSAVDSGDVNVALAELRLMQNRLEEAELYALNAYEFYRCRLGEGSPMRVYTQRLLALVLKHRGRDKESSELFLSADISEQLLIETNESLADAYRIALQRRSELSILKPQRLDVPDGMFVSLRTASLLSRVGLLKHWQLYSWLRLGLVALMAICILNTELSTGMKLILLVIQSCCAWIMPNFFLARFSNMLEQQRVNDSSGRKQLNS